MRRMAFALALLCGLLWRSAADAEADGRRLLTRRLLPFVNIDIGKVPSVPVNIDVGKVVSDSGKLAQDAGKFTQDTTTDLAGKATMTFSALRDSFKEAQQLVEDATKIGQSVYGQTQAFGKDMKGIYADFKPLEPVFASEYGMVPLIGSKDKMATLVGVVRKLLGTAGNVFAISSAVGSLSDTCNQLFDILTKELEKLKVRRRLAEEALGQQPQDARRLGPDYTQLLGGLDFESMTVTFHKLTEDLQTVGTSLKFINATLDPHLAHFEAVLSGRRLVTKSAQADKEEYEHAILSVMPAWRTAESSTIQICTQSNLAIANIESLDCRVKGFTDKPQLPGMDSVKQIVETCEKAAATKTKTTSCPDVSYSASVKDAMSSNSGFLGWLCVGVNYAITYNTATRIIFAVLLFLLPGIIFCFFGYRWKDVEFWFEGFFAGFVMFSAIFSILVVWGGVCRGTLIKTCDFKWTLVLVLVLSAIWASVVVKGEKCNVFFGGFDLGCMLGGVIFIWQNYTELLHMFLDPEVAKMEVVLLLTSAVVTGVLFGGLTLYFQKPAIVFATSVIGGALIMASVFIICPLLGLGHEPSYGDLAGWVVFTIIGIAVQYKFTNPVDDIKEGIEELKEDIQKGRLDGAEKLDGAE